MIFSMTAFARQSQQYDWGSAVWELRSVNQRYLEPNFKLPESQRSLEPALREKLRKQLNRGKLECGLRLQMSAARVDTLQINQPLLRQLIVAGEVIQGELAAAAAIDPLQLLQWPGVISEQTLDSDTLQEQLLAQFQQALEQLLDTRQREGEQMRLVIEQRLDAIDIITSAVRQQMPEILKAQRSKLQQRLEELQVELDPARLEQEISLLAQKADVDEELDRLVTHTTEVRRVLTKGGPCGRRLDFLMQELNREANTLSSKAIISDSSQAAVELKVLIEQMREQIQNIE